ncbi:hypothetical protein PTKIN_Ptkin01aG0066000 [Pterospermum kingtungense]
MVVAKLEKSLHFSSESAAEECIVGGYSMPHATMLLINAWSIQRDPNLWVDATNSYAREIDGMEGEGPLLLASKHMNYDSTTIGAAPYGHHWRNLRRIAAVEIFSTSRLNMFLSIRQDEVKYLLRNLFEISHQSFTEVEMKSRLSELSFNIIMRMLSGKRYFGVEVDDFNEARWFRDMIKEALELFGDVYPEDFLPFFRWIDFKISETRMLKLQLV